MGAGKVEDDETEGSISSTQAKLPQPSGLSNDPSTACEKLAAKKLTSDCAWATPSGTSAD